MESSREAGLNVPSDVSKLTKVQKLAALLVMLSPENAAQIIKHLEEYELEAVSAEMTKFTMISQEMQIEILREFSDVAVQAGTAIVGGVDCTQSLLEKAVGSFKASEIISRVSPSRAPVAAMQQIVEMDGRHIFNLIRHEQPQTIALVISYLSPEKASQLLSLIRPEVREQVIERLATLAPTPIEVVEKVVEVLQHKLGNKHTRALNQTGGVKMAAQVLNALDKTVSKSILISLEERNPELGQAVRQKMFTFEDLARLDATALQKILREVDMRDLAVSLKTASEKLKTTLLSCISKRAAETVHEEIGFLGTLKLREIEAAQLKIIEVVRRLEGEGEIESEKRRRILDMKQPPPETIHFVQLLRDVRLASASGSSKEADQRRQESEQASFERGRVDGERSLSEQLMRQRAELIQLQNGVLESLRQVVPQVKEDCQALLVNLAMEVAKKLVADLPVSVEMVEAAIREALAQAEESPEFNIFLHPEDLTLLEKVNSSLKQIKGGIHFHSSAEVTRGGCLVQTSFGVIDARRETKFESLKKSLLS